MFDSVSPVAVLVEFKFRCVFIKGIVLFPNIISSLQNDVNHITSGFKDGRYQQCPSFNKQRTKWKSILNDQVTLPVITIVCSEI